MAKRSDTDPLPNPAERNKHWKRVGENRWREMGDDEALSRRYKGFNIKRDKPTKKGTGFTMMIHKKIKGFEEEVDMKEDDIEQDEGGEQGAEPQVADLVAYAVDQKPLEFQQSFAELMQQRIADEVYNKKLEIASQFLGPTQYEVEDNGSEEEEEDVGEVEEPEEASGVQEEEEMLDEAPRKAATGVSNSRYKDPEVGIRAHRMVHKHSARYEREHDQFKGVPKKL